MVLREIRERAGQGGFHETPLHSSFSFVLQEETRTMEPKVRLTQKDLVFGIYRAGKKGGLNIWFRDRYVWPLRRKSAAVSKSKVQPATPDNHSSSSPRAEEVEPA